MEYFVYCRDNPDTAALRDQTLEAHWTFMDGYADGMIARGPTLSEDGETATGSLHIVDLPNPAAAHVFAYEEPNYKTGIYGEVMLRRWRNVLGRKMWGFRGGPQKNRRFLVIAHGRKGAAAEAESLSAAHDAFAAERRDRIIVGGPLLSDDGTHWQGTALTTELPTQADVEALLAEDPLARAGLYAGVEIHRWEFGGRR